MAADLEKAKLALRRAHEVGDVESARRIAKYLKAQQQPSAEAPGMVSGLARAALQGATFNFGDELEASARALADVTQGQGFSESYDRNVADIRQDLGAFREAHPALALGAELAGGFAVPGLGAAGAVGRGATLAARVGRGVALGAGAGALAGAGAAEGGLAERATGAIPGAVVGAGVGAAVPAVGAALGRVGRFWSKARGPKAPTIEQLEGEARALYESARNAGVQITPDAWTGFVDDITARVQREGIDPTLHPRATAVAKRLADTRGQSLSLDQTETMRRVLKDAASGSAPDERRLANIMIERFDDWRDALKRADVLAGDPKAVSLLPKARGLWSRAKKGEIIGDLIERAELRASQFSQSGTENALRTEFRQLARNVKKMRGFSKEEQAAIRAVANGAPVANAVRFLGKFAPRGVVSTALGGGAGFAIGGPVGSAALLGAGEVARAAADRMTRNRALAARDLALRGTTLPPAAIPRLGSGAGARALTTGVTVPLAAAASRPLYVDIRDDDIPGPNRPRR